MPMPRKDQIRKQKNTYYHCVTRSVRKMFLCGYDEHTGCDYEYRRQWIVDRINLLSQIFSVDVCAYAIMNNHYHIVLHVDYEQSLTWDAKSVVQRWWRIFPPKMLQEETDDDIIAFHLDRLAADEEKVQMWRDRLADLSWFMRCLNEHISRRANREDNCTGHFWEERFKSQILLDTAALVTCMAYVDLNPIRAKMAETPETSDYTSIKNRIDRSKLNQQHDFENTKPDLPTMPELMPFANSQQDSLTRCQQHSGEICLPIAQSDYFKLVDWTGRKIKEGKRGAIPNDLSPILKRLEIKEDQWVDGVQHYGRRFYKVVGVMRNMIDETLKQGRCWFKGQGFAKLLYDH